MGEGGRYEGRQCWDYNDTVRHEGRQPSGIPGPDPDQEDPGVLVVSGLVFHSHFRKIYLPYSEERSLEY